LSVWTDKHEVSIYTDTIDRHTEVSTVVVSRHLGRPGTGRAREVWAVSIPHFERTKVAKEWIGADNLGACSLTWAYSTTRGQAWQTRRATGSTQLPWAKASGYEWVEISKAASTSR
jgi:hypothetical protein